jgi:hypothetical protein
MQKTAKIALIAPIASLLILAMWAVPASADDTFIAVLNSGQEIPKPDSNALGNALMTFQKSTGLLCYSISFTPLAGNEIAAHFHAPASAGENASILFFITPGPSPVGSPKTGCVGPLTKKEKGRLNQGLFYINIHSDVFPAGEIRGQVLRFKGARTRGAVAE